MDKILQRLFSIPVISGNVQSVQQLLDNTRSCLSQLNALSVDTTTWNSILVFLTSQKLDLHTRKEWELSLKTSTSIPSIQEMLTFLETTFRALECVQEEKPNKSLSTNRTEHRRKPTKMVRAYNAVSTTLDENCPCCKKRHSLYKCFKFATLSSTEKKLMINKHRLCRNCLGSGHLQADCKLSTRCQRCGEPHHTVVHQEYYSAITAPISQPVSTSTPTAPTVSTHHTNANQIAPALLATLKVTIKINDKEYIVKALVDQGSQASFISQELAQLLPIPQRKAYVDVSGIGGNKSIRVKKSIDLKLSSTYDKQFVLKVKALIVPVISKYVPPKLNINSVSDFPQIYLADTNFLMSEKIDLLLGNDVYGDLLLPNMKKLDNGLFLQETHFGYMVSGVPKSVDPDTTIFANLCSLDKQLRLFWEQEEILEERPFTPEEKLCEKFFEETHTRDESGRFIVHLPFKSLLHGKPLPNFSFTDFSALKRLKQLETSFQNKPRLVEEYKKFMAEYEALNHMAKLGEYPHALPKNAYCFPHHGVLKESNTTTKLYLMVEISGPRRPL